ncbi:MAG: hypothetical protein J4G12_00320 [Gemmatimonadetes bacterium]|nr:hypothetical protein [Gemmatimonadota bacterium]
MNAILSRRSFSFAAAAALVVLSIGCSPPVPAEPPPPPPPPPLDPTGVFDVALELLGDVVEGVMTVEGSAEEGYTGHMEVMGEGVDILEMSVNDDVVAFAVDAQGMYVAFELAFEADASGFSGVFDSDMGGGTIIGTRR